MWPTLPSSQSKTANKPFRRSVQRGLLIAVSGGLLIGGSVLLYRQASIAINPGGLPHQPNLPALNVVQLQGQISDLQGAFPVDSVERFSYQREGKEAFSLLLGHYLDGQGQKRHVVTFPKGKAADATLPDSGTIRHTVWQEAGAAIKQHAPPNALILSWWDDGQRIHFFCGIDTWLYRPAHVTFSNPIWQPLKASLFLADETEQQRLQQMAHWLTMDYAKSLAEIRKTFGESRPIFIVVTNDLLLRLTELESYGGKHLPLVAINLPAHDNLHGDIAHVKQWAAEAGDGNYLVQKEGLNYQVWATQKNNEPAKQSLLLRLLPFVESLKQSPAGAQLVYQSHWGGYLSIYKVVAP